MKAHLLVPFLACLLGGCLAVPHLDQRSPEVRGRVVDVFAGTPVQDARVEFIENPALAVLTDANGEFVIRATLKPELFLPLTPAVGEMNIGARIEPFLRVTCDGYWPREVDASKLEHLDELLSQVDRTRPVSAQGPLQLKPILLAPLVRR